MSNNMIHKFVIKLCEDNVYDLYVDDIWIASRTHYENIINELRKAMEVQ